jgi:hypothetical protein
MNPASSTKTKWAFRCLASLSILGNSSDLHLEISASSRFAACFAGLMDDQCSWSWRTCHTPLRQKTIAKVLLITSPTRPDVHISFSQPCAVAPFLSNCSSSASCCSFKLRGRPERGFDLRLSPASAFCSHTFNECLQTPRLTLFHQFDRTAPAKLQSAFRNHSSVPS